MIVTYGTALQTSAVPFGVLRAHAGAQVCRAAGLFEVDRRFGCAQGRHITEDEEVLASLGEYSMSTFEARTEQSTG